MSTASNSTHSTENRNGQYAKFDEYVDYQVSRTGSHIKANDLLTTAVGIATIFLGYLLIFILCDHWLIKGGFGHLARLIMLAGVILASLGWAVWKLVIPYFKKVTRLYSAHALEQTSDEMQGALLNLIDLQKSGRKVNPEIISSLEKRAALTLSQTDTDHAVDRRPLMRLSYGLLFVVAILCFYALFSPKQIWPSLSAAMSFSSQREFATQTQISSVTPGNTEVLAGSQLEVVVDLRGEVPENVTLYYTSSDQGRVNEPIKLRALDDTLKQFQGLIVGVNGRGIRQNLTYHIEAGDAVSDEYQVSVIQPPSATVHAVRYDYPDYMELAAVEQPGGAIDAYEGTQVTLDATTNMPISSFEVLFSDEEDSASPLEEFQIKKTINKNSITAAWKLKLRADGTFPKYYQIKCRNEAGQTTLSPTVYPLMIRRDLPPEISLLAPRQDLKVPSNGTVPISVVAEDPDFKLRYLNLRVEKQQIRILDKTLFEGERKSVGINYDLALEPLRLTPGDTVYFWIEARDNKHPSGNRKNTPKIKIEITEPVSPEEARQQLEEQKQKAAEQNQQKNPDQKPQQGEKGGQEKQPGQQPGDQSMPDQNQKGNSKSETGKQPGDQKQPGNENQQQSQQPGQKKSDSPDAGSEQNQEPGNGQKQSQPDKQEGSEKKEGLDSDGSDDQEALKKILEKLKKEGQQPGSEQKEQGNQDDQGSKEQGNKQQDSKQQDTPDSNSEKGMQEPQSNGADSKSRESSSSPDKNSQGAPGKGQDQNGDKKPQSSAEADDPDQKPSGQQQPAQEGKVKDGKKEPSDSAEAARKMKSDGEGKGQAKPDHDPNAKPERSKNDVKRDPNEKPAMRPGDKKNPDGAPQQKPENSSSKPGQADNPPNQKPGSEMRKPEQQNDNPSPANQQQGADAKKSPQKQDQPDGSNQPPGGKPRSTDQKSKRPQDGENGNSSQNDQGQKGSQQPGKGDSGGKQGNQEQGAQGKPSGSKQSMQQNQPQNKQGQNSPKQDQKQQDQNQAGSNNQKNSPSQQGNKSGGQKGGKSGGQQGSNQSGKGSSSGKGQSQKNNSQAAGSSKGASSSNPQGSSATTGGSAPGEGDSGGAGESPALPDADDANLEYGKEAANLVLKRIKDELKRKEVDQDLLKELGWTREEMKQFSDRLQKQLQTPQNQDLQTPESIARKRQFEEMLKSLKPASQAARRNRTSTREQTSDSLGPRRLPVPEEYREAYEAFTRDLANQKPAEK